MKKISAAGSAALVFGHCAGMIDLVALPVWIGIVLIGQLGFGPQQSGGLITMFLASVVASSLYFAPRLGRLRRRLLVPIAFLVAAGAFASMAGTKDYGMLAIAHVIAGLAVGCALSLTHGTMGASDNPHRLASIAFTAMGLMSVVFLATVPQLAGQFGAAALFYTLSGIMAAAAVMAMLMFPDVSGEGDGAHGGAQPKLPSNLWFGMAGVSFLALNQAMVFGFLERIGIGHGFSGGQVAALLMGLGIVNLFPAAVAGFLENRVRAAAVMSIGPVVQGAMGLAVAQAPGYAVYAFGASMFIATLIFTHTFAFGYLAREDRTGRAVAATPVMVMTGSACGPIIGGVIAEQLGYGSIGWAALVVGIVSAICFRICVRDRNSLASAGAAA